MSREVIRKILWANDLHKKAIDPPNIVGYTNVQRILQRDLMNVIVENECDTFISGGDWYDRGYTDDSAAALADVDFDREMAVLLKGEFYGLIGNHLRIKMDSNPELYLIQPHDRLMSRIPVARDEQIMKTPNKLKFGTVQISFLHYNHDRRTLAGNKPERDEDTTYHIALFHTPMIIPNQQLMSAGLRANTNSSTAIGECLRGVDLALCADIHKPLGTFTVNHDYGSTTMIVPGSLMNTTAATDDRHLSVNLPMMTVYSDGTVKLELVPFNLRTNLLQFKGTGKKEKKNLDGQKITKSDRKNMGEGDLKGVFDRSAPDAFSLKNLMVRKNYTPEDIEMIQIICNDPLNIQKLIEVYRTQPEEL